MPFHPFQPKVSSFLPRVLHLHVLWGKHRLGHLVSILYQFIEFAVHQDARVRVQPCGGQDHVRDHTRCSPSPFPAPTHLSEAGCEGPFLNYDKGTAKGLLPRPHHTMQRIPAQALE